MKPAPFIRHVPRTVAEAVEILAEVAPQDGRVLAGGQSLVPIMAFRLAKPAHLVDINEIGELGRIASDGKLLSIGAGVRHAAFHKPVIDGPLGALLAARGAPHRALSDPHARHLLRQPRPCRPGLGMVPGGGDARRHHGRAERARRARRSRPRIFSHGIMATALAEDELLTASAAAAARRPTPGSASTSSAAAPAISP